MPTSYARLSGKLLNRSLPKQCCKGCCHWEALFEGRESHAGLCHKFALGAKLNAWPITEANDGCSDPQRVDATSEQEPASICRVTEIAKKEISHTTLVRTAKLIADDVA